MEHDGCEGRRHQVTEDMLGSIDEVARDPLIVRSVEGSADVLQRR